LWPGIWGHLPAVQGPHDANPGEHRRAAFLGHQDQRLHRGLPLWRGMLFLRQLGDVLAGITQRDKLSAVYLNRLLRAHSQDNIQRNGANRCAIIVNHRDRIVMADQLRASFAQRPSKPDSFYLRLRFAWKVMHSEIRDKVGIDELE
jgi:hypothetical protein